MPGFFYFLPDTRGQVSDNLLSRFGLLHIREIGDNLHCREVIRGPDGKQGLMCGNARNWQPEEVKQSDSLTWKLFPKSHAEAQAYCGWQTDKLPKPEELARKVQLAGEWLTLADGNRWLIPIARKVTQDGSYCALPLAFDLDDETGEWKASQVQADYKRIWDHANAYYDAMLEASDKVGPGESIKFPIPSYERLVSDAIAANYRTSMREIATLGVLTSSVAGEIARVLIDSNGFSQLKKKEEADTGNG